MSQLYLKDAGSLPGMANIEFVTGDDAVAVPPNPATHVWFLVGNSTQGVSTSGNAGTFTTTITVADATTTQKGVVTLPTAVIALNYTNVTNAMSPYTVLATDYFISCDASAGPVTLNFPNAPTAKREFIIKDRLGFAATNPINITTVGGVVTIDGSTTLSFTDNYESLEMLFNGTTYESF
jgi:hypothetical protein